MLRFEISEHSQGALPAIDIDDDVIVIGSGSAARVRLPAEVARAAHVRFDGHSFTLLAESVIGGMVRAAGDSGPVGHGMVVELGKYRVRISAAPSGTPATPQHRTESLARELVRALLGEGSAPSLSIEHGPNPGSTRALPPPEATLIIGRGDEATWVILDEDLSRAHASVHRGWDGVTVTDLGSKNGTRVDGTKVGTTPVELHDGGRLALGDVILRFHDPAELHLRGGAPPAPAAPPLAASDPLSARAASALPVVVFAAIAILAVVALIWILAS